MKHYIEFTVSQSAASLLPFPIFFSSPWAKLRVDRSAVQNAARPVLAKKTRESGPVEGLAQTCEGRTTLGLFRNGLRESVCNTNTRTSTRSRSLGRPRSATPSTKFKISRG